MKIWSFYFMRFYLARRYRNKFSLLLVKFLSFFELLAKMFIIKMKKRIDQREKESRLKDTRKHSGQFSKNQTQFVNDENSFCLQ